MEFFTEILGLNIQAVKNLADVHYGYANHLITQEDSRYRPYIASSFLITAMLQSLINPQSSIKAFQRSASFYQEDKNPFWKIVAVCGNDRGRLYGTISETGFENMTSPDHQFADILGYQFLNTSNGRAETLYTKPAFLSQPVGRLGLPMSVYMNAFIGLNELSHDPLQNGRILEPWAILLNRAAERTRLLQSDTYHWENLKGTFIPLEPEVLATCMSLCQVAKTKEIDIDFLTERIQVDRIAKVPLLIAKEILQDS